MPCNNVADQLTTVTAPGSFVTTVGYDGLGRKISVADPDLGTWGYTYDAAGNLAMQTDARGITLWFKYDSLNRLTEKRQTDAAGPLLAQYFYDEAQTGYANLGRRTRATAYEYRDGWGSSVTLTNTLAQSYDGRGRVKTATRTVDGAAYTTQYTYDPADRVIRITYPDGEQVTTAYGSQGQPASLSSTLGVTLADSASYDEANRLRSLRYPAGGNLVRRQVYYPWHQLNGRGRLQSLFVGASATVADRLNLTYAYDAVGNVQSINDNGALSSFGYDGLYQLTSAYGQSFSYDTASRLVNYNGLIYTPDAAHPHAVDKVANVDRYDYDANGNQVVRNKGVVNQEQVLAWDAENRLSSVTYTNLASAGGGGGPPSTLPKRVFLPLIMQQQPVERYSYDADGGRVRKESKSEITRIIGPHYEVIVAVASGQVLTTTKYYQFGGQRIAVRQNGTLSYLHGDHLGSTSVATNASGMATSSARYFAYGGQRSGDLLALPTDHGFTDQKLDRGTGLLYYGARYYDSALGMFISPDTIVPQPGDPLSLNRYSYVENQPLRYTDPTGCFSEDQIMHYLDANTWEDVLALFEDGGTFAGRWGVLELLREADLGASVQVLEGWSPWGIGSVDDYTVDSGILSERDGRLVLESKGSSMTITSMGQKGNAYYVEPKSSPSRQIYADVKYVGPRVKRDINWVGVGFDIGGVAADAVSFGAAGRIVNAVQVAKSAQKVGQALDVAGTAYAFGSGAVEFHQKGRIDDDTGRSMIYSVAGFFPGLGTISDAVSAIDGIFYWGP